MAEAQNSSNNARWIVQIDPDIADLVPGFLENRRRDILNVQEALGRGDFNGLAMLGHTMKGAGAGYGFDEITNIGAAMEVAAKQADAEAVREALGRLANYLEHVEVQYE